MSATIRDSLKLHQLQKHPDPPNPTPILQIFLFCLHVSSKTLSLHFWKGQDHLPGCTLFLGHGRYFKGNSNLLLFVLQMPDIQISLILSGFLLDPVPICLRLKIIVAGIFYCFPKTIKGEGEKDDDEKVRLYVHCHRHAQL